MIAALLALPVVAFLQLLIAAVFVYWTLLLVLMYERYRGNLANLFFLGVLVILSARDHLLTLPLVWAAGAYVVACAVHLFIPDEVWEDDGDEDEQDEVKEEDDHASS